MTDVRIGVQVSQVDRTFTKNGEPFHALKATDLTVTPGEFISLLGPSGCGKSTLLRLIAGLDTPTSGTVSIAGQPVVGTRRDVGVMFQKAVLFPWRTLEENLLLPVELAGKPTPEDHARVERILHMVELEAFRNNYPRELSGGMQQRAALGRVLMRDPQVLLLDEPFGALDEFTRERLNIDVGRLVKEAGITVILVTHSITEAVFMADRVVMMGTRPGRIIGDISVPAEQSRDATFLTSELFQKTVVEVRRTLDSTSEVAEK